MLSEKLPQNKEFDDLMQEARIQIPLYSKEWTNFNPSDPAITTLENLSVYTIIQQSYTNNVSAKAREKIFGLLGYERRNGKNARVMLQALNVDEPVIIPSGQRFLVGDLCYETNREFVLYGNRILGLYGVHNGQIKDYSVLLDKDIPLEISVFTDKPEKGMEFYIVIDDEHELPEEINMYMDFAVNGNRNPIENLHLFADMKWQCYTGRGFTDIKCRDNTGSFLVSGEIRLKLPKDRMKVYEELPQKGYVIRVVLTKAEYDIPPRMKGLYGFLFEVWQKETQSICYTFSDKDKLDVYCDILENEYIQLFCKEDDGYYHRYDAAPNGVLNGRFYNIAHYGYGNYGFEFDKERYGYGPGNYENAVKLVAYDEEIMRQYDLGQVYGYDDQTIELPVKDIVKESFSIILAKKLKNSEVIYEFVKPDCTGTDDFKYSLIENESKMIINDAAGFIGSRIYMCACATSKGEQGNVRANTIFKPVGYDTDIVFTNPEAGTDGCTKESLEDLRHRFMKDFQNHYTAVKADDYENIVRTTPGLCIHKVKAVADIKSNKVNIAVKPYGNIGYPTLSNVYMEVIRKRIEDRRLLSTAVEILQPVYAAVDVQGTIYVKPHFENCYPVIEAVIKKELDYINNSANFGDRLNFDELFHKIEALECVDFIYDLSVISKQRRYAEQKGSDIVPASNCLLYPGTISIELNTME